MSYQIERQNSTKLKITTKPSNPTNSFVQIFSKIYEKLFQHQKDALPWLYETVFLGNNGSIHGGVLADDMGLGKTITVAAHILELFLLSSESKNKQTVPDESTKNGQHNPNDPFTDDPSPETPITSPKPIKIKILIVGPLSLMSNWEKELNIWCPGVQVHDCTSKIKSKKHRLRNMKNCLDHGGIALANYDQISTGKYNLFRFKSEKESKSCLELGNTRSGILWDYCILDEAHAIRNKSKRNFRINEILAKKRLALTGTPIQNKMDDFYRLIDWATHSKIFKTEKFFQQEFGKVIEDARLKNAEPIKIQQGIAATEKLKILTDPFILQRSKWDLNLMVDKNGKLVKKTDVVVHCMTSQKQQELIRRYVMSDDVQIMLGKSGNTGVLAKLGQLINICNSPRICNLVDENEYLSIQEKVRESGKLEFLAGLLKEQEANFKSKNVGGGSKSPKTIIFSRSKKILTILEQFLDEVMGFSNNYVRLDGDVKPELRQTLVDDFNNLDSIKIMLLTTQVGREGLTLTAANRVVIFQPSWNPSEDAQAVDRAYRIGQKQHVVVYRLVTSGTVEEHVFKRQIYKSGIIKTALDSNTNSDAKRYLDNDNLKGMFKIDKFEVSETCDMLNRIHGTEFDKDEPEWLKEHLKKLINMRGFNGQRLAYGFNFTSRMYSVKNDDFDDGLRVKNLDSFEGMVGNPGFSGGFQENSDGAGSDGSESDSDLECISDQVATKKKLDMDELDEIHNSAKVFKKRPKLKQEVFTIDGVKPIKIESDSSNSDSDDCKSNSSENMLNEIIRDKYMQKPKILKTPEPINLISPDKQKVVTVPKSTKTIINPKLTQSDLPHGVPLINEHTRSSLMRSLQGNIHKNLAIRDFSKSETEHGIKSPFIKTHAYSYHLARQIEYQLVRKPGYASMTQRKLREIKISNNKNLESSVVKDFEASFSDSDRIRMFQLTGYEVPAKITNKKLDNYFQNNKVISPEKKVVHKNKNVEQQLKKQILSTGFENRRVAHDFDGNGVGRDSGNRVRQKHVKTVSKHVKKVITNDYEKPFGGIYDFLTEKKQLVQPVPTKKPSFMTKYDERQSNVEYKLKGAEPKTSVLRSPTLEISSTKSPKSLKSTTLKPQKLLTLPSSTKSTTKTKIFDKRFDRITDSDEKTAIRDKWSKNFIIPALQRMYSGKMIDKPNFKKLAKYLTDFCANNKDLARGTKTRKFIETYVKHFMDKHKIKGFISESGLTQLKRSLAHKLVEKDKK